MDLKETTKCQLLAHVVTCFHLATKCKTHPTGLLDWKRILSVHCLRRHVL